MFCLRRALAQFLASTPSSRSFPRNRFTSKRVYTAHCVSPVNSGGTHHYTERERKPRNLGAAPLGRHVCTRTPRAPCIAPLRHGSRNASVHACAPLDGRQVALQGRAATRTVCNSTNAPPLTPLRIVDLHEPPCACALATAYPRHAHMRARPNLSAGTLIRSLFPLLYSFDYSLVLLSLYFPFSISSRSSSFIYD